MKKRIEAPGCPTPRYQRPPPSPRLAATDGLQDPHPQLKPGAAGMGVPELDLSSLKHGNCQGLPSKGNESSRYLPTGPTGAIVGGRVSIIFPYQEANQSPDSSAISWAITTDEETRASIRGGGPIQEVLLFGTHQSGQITIQSPSDSRTFVLGELV